MKKYFKNRDIVLISLLGVLTFIIGIYTWIVIASLAINWLVSYDVLNPNNNFVLVAMGFLYRITDPVLMIFRPFLPVVGGIDLSPFAVILFLWFLRAVIGRFIMRIVIKQKKITKK